MPLLAVGLGAAALGTGLTIAGNAQDQSAINAARNTEAGQEAALQKQGNTVFQNSVTANSEPTAVATLAKGQAQRASIAQALQTATTGANTQLPTNQQPTYQVSNPDGTTATNTAATRTATAGNAWSNVVNTAANKLGSYGDLATAQGVANQQANNQLGVIGTQAKQDASILPVEIQAASHKGDALTGWGSIVSALGSVASLGAASGLGGAGTAANAWAQAAQTM